MSLPTEVLNLIKLIDEVKNGNVMALFQLADKYKYGNDYFYCNDIIAQYLYEIADNNLHKCIEENDDNAICQLGIHYCKGIHGLDSDVLKAKELFEKALSLNNNNDTAMYYLADIYGGLYESNMPQNIHKSVHYYNMAIEHNNYDATKQMAYNYRYGNLIKKDLVKAAELYKKMDDKKEFTNIATELLFDNEYDGQILINFISLLTESDDMITGRGTSNLNNTINNIRNIIKCKNIEMGHEIGKTILRMNKIPNEIIMNEITIKMSDSES